METPNFGHNPSPNFKATPPQPPVASVPPVSVDSPPVIPPSPLESLMLEPKKSSLLKIILVAVVLVLIGSGGTLVALYTNLWSPSWNPFFPADDKVFQVAVSRMQNLRSYKIDSISTTFMESNPFLGEIIVRFSVSGILGQKSKDFQTAGKIEVSLGGLNFSVDAEARKIEEKMYLKMPSLPLFVFSQLDKNLPAKAGEWMEADLEKAKELLKELDSQKWMDKESEKEKQIEKLIRERVLGQKVFKIKERLAQEKIDGKPMVKYALELDKPAVKDFVAEMVKILGPEISDERKKEMFAEFDVFLESFDPNVEVWIGKRDKYIHRIKVNGVVEEKQKDGSNILPDLGSKKTTYDVEINLSEFNKKVEIQKPENAKNIDSWLEKALDNFRLQKILDVVQDNLSSMKSMASNLNFTKRSYLAMSCQNTEQNLTTYHATSYPQTFKQACENIEKETGQKPVIKASKTDYCIYGLVEEKYYCTTSRDYTYLRPTDLVTVDPGQKGYCDGFNFKCPRPEPVQSTAPAKVRDAKIQAAFSQARSFAEMIQFDTGSYLSVCKSGTLNTSVATYGTSMETLADELYSMNASSSTVCYASKNDYCVSKGLASGGYICISSSGKTGNDECKSATTVCSP